MSLDATALLGLPYIAAAQAQKHVTHNEALDLLDAVVQLAVLSDTVASPPGAPSEGDRYIIPPSGASDAFAGWANAVAIYRSGSWVALTPARGWTAFVLDRGEQRVFDGAAWQAVALTSNLPLLGINATADTINRLTVASAATLFNNAGSGHQLKLNKASAGDTASLLYQTGFSGRAEMGLAGSDAFQIKVSADGAAWSPALQIAGGTGAVAFSVAPSLPGLNGGPLAGLRNRVLNGGFTVNQRAYASGTALAAGAYGFDRWRAGSGGATLTVSAGLPDTTVTIAAGSLQQAIEPGNVEGGGYTLSWSGTASGRIQQGAAPAYAASPITVSGLTAGTQIIVEFTGGSLGRVQLEPGATATPFERRPAGAELALCQRYFYAGGATLFRANAASAFGGGLTVMALPVTMRATPTIAVSGLAGSYTATAPVSTASPDRVQFTFGGGSTPGDTQSFGFSANAEL